MTTTAVQAAWGLCLAVAALLLALGLELHLDGAGPAASYPVVVGAILLLPVASAVLERVGHLTSAPPEG